MIAWMILAASPPALAADPDPWWAGSWGLDPSRSDDPTPLVDRAAVAPVTATPSSRQLAPDGGEEVAEDAQQKARFTVLGVLGRSGWVALAPLPEGLAVDWGDGATALQGSRWAKATDRDGERFKVRVGLDEEVLVVERRFGTTVLTESWLPPGADADPRTRVVVVVVRSPSLAEDIEFRRIYRRLDAPSPAPTPAPPL